MKEKPLSLIGDRLPQFIKYVVLAGAGLYIAIYLWMVYHRLQYPFELEWIEGGMVDQVQRVVNGESLYVAPSVSFVPFLYPPVYFYLSALVSALFGVGLFSLRLVSLAASLTSFTAIFLIVRDETRDSPAAFLSVGLFAAAFRVTGAWLDVARVDSLFLALFLLFVYFVRRNQSAPSLATAGLFASLAFLTKQTALIVCLPVAAYLLYQSWRRITPLLATTLSIVGLTTLLLNYTSHGWYTFYVFRLLLQQADWTPSDFASFWKTDLFDHLPIAICFVVFFLVIKFIRQDRALSVRWSLILAGALAGTFLTRVKVGGYDNVLLPAYAVIAILFGLGLSELLKLLDRLKGSRRAAVEICIYAACIIQLALLHYNPLAQIPTRADLEDGRKLVRMLSSVRGQVYLPYHGYVPTLAGKKTFAHQSAIWDVMRGDQQTAGKVLLNEELAKAIRQQSFDMIVLDLEWNYLPELDTYYVRTGEVFQDQTAYFPVTGWPIRPTYVYVPKRP